MQYCPAVIIGGNTLGRRLEFTVPKEYDGKKVIHLLRGFAGVSVSYTHLTLPTICSV